MERDYPSLLNELREAAKEAALVADILPHPGAMLDRDTGSMSDAEATEYMDYWGIR